MTVLKPTSQLKLLHTIIRDANTSRHDFIFYADRLSRILIETALSKLPYEQNTVVTPTGSSFTGSCRTDMICGVSVIRAGATMEQALRNVIKDVPIGKILIQTDESTGEPQLHYCKLPNDIPKRQVFITDAQTATGSAALMAIRVILDHDVPQEQIYFLCLIASPVGIQNILRAFPRINIITSELDLKMNDDLYLLPGFGNFGDRYFGTD